jgi:hypothetical protein
MMSNNCIIKRSVDEIAKFSELLICALTMAIFWFYGKIIAIVFFVDCEIHVSPFLPHRKFKPYSAYGNLVSPCLASQKMETLFHLVLRHRKWKPCFTLFSLTEKWKPCFSLFCLSEKNSQSCFLEGFV